MGFKGGNGHFGRRNGEAAARQIPAKHVEGSVDENTQQLFLMRTGLGAEIPKVGVESQVTGGAHKPHQLAAAVLEHTQLPETVFKGDLPVLFGVRRFLAGGQQLVD